MSKPIHLAFLVLLCLALLGVAGEVQAQGDSTWVGEYFDNPILDGQPALVRVDTAINFTWGDGAPDPALPADGFSVRWTGAQVFQEGTYRFSLRCNDGMRVYIDGNLLVDAWASCPPNAPVIEDRFIRAGQHPLRVEFFDTSGPAVASLSWGPIATTPEGTTPAITTPRPPSPPPSSATTRWVAEYYNNTGLSAPAVHTEDITGMRLNRNWRTGSPAPGVVNADNFSARFTRTLNFNGRLVRFAVLVDDGFRFYIDGELVLDEWHVAAGRPFFVDRALAAGAHTLVLDMYEGVEAASALLDWAYLDPAVATTSTVIAHLNNPWLNVRNGPGTAYPLIGRLYRSQGDQAYVATARGAENPTWLRINYEDYQAWISGNYVRLQGDAEALPFVTAEGVIVTLPQDTTAPGTGGPTVTTGLRVRARFDLNIRSWPTHNTTRVGVLPLNAAADVIGRSNDGTWWQISYQGSQGWVPANGVQQEGNVNARVPVTG